MANHGKEVTLGKKVYDKSAYEKTIDTSFSELISPVEETTPQMTVGEFFGHYNELFYDIPKTGINSHETLVAQSTDYIGSQQIQDSIQALLDEISNLREENLELQQQIVDLTVNNNGNN